MFVEIERKFLVQKDKWQKPAKGCHMVQGYLAKDGCTLRVRIADDKAFLTIKGPTTGFSRAEFEYEIPVADAQEMLKLSLYPPVEKTRYLYPYQGKTWEVDEFAGANEGLLMAEIELKSEDEVFEKPAWLAKEVTGDKRYYNARLSREPYSTWK